MLWTIWRRTGMGVGFDMFLTREHDAQRFRLRQVLRRICDEPEEFSFRSLNLVDDERESQGPASRFEFEAPSSQCQPGSGTTWEPTRRRSSSWKS